MAWKQWSYNSVENQYQRSLLLLTSSLSLLALGISKHLMHHPCPCLRVALKKGSLLQLLQVPSKGWEEKKLLCKEMDLNLHGTCRAVKHLLNPKTLNYFQACCIFRSEQFDTGSSNYRGKKNQTTIALFHFRQAEPVSGGGEGSRGVTPGGNRDSCWRQQF